MTTTAAGTTGGGTSTAPLLGPGTAGDAPVLSSLALRSKGFWGYDAAFLEACRAELTLTPAQAMTATVARPAPDGPIVGFHLLAAQPDGPRDAGELAMLFVDPSAIGSGVGRALLADAVSQGRQRGWTRLQIEADPGAEAFYLAQGARRVGEVRSGSVVGRVLPLLELTPRARGQ